MGERDEKWGSGTGKGGKGIKMGTEERRGKHSWVKKRKGIANTYIIHVRGKLLKMGINVNFKAPIFPEKKGRGGPPKKFPGAQNIFSLPSFVHHPAREGRA